jgi:D-glycero-D-manno-heptose 1,7-bisphosphate phosphatase
MAQTRRSRRRHPTVFLDRDGTLVRYREYPAVPQDLCLCEDIGPCLLRIRRAGFRLAVVTNQSGVARLFTEADVRRMQSTSSAN